MRGYAFSRMRWKTERFKKRTKRLFGETRNQDMGVWRLHSLRIVSV